MNKFIHFLIGICFLANTLPSTLEHVFGEKHEHDSHVCASDYCFQEDEVDCDTIDIAENKKFSHFPNYVSFVFLSESFYENHYSSLFSNRVSQDIRLRGPPIVV